MTVESKRLINFQLLKRKLKRLANKEGILIGAEFFHPIGYLVSKSCAALAV